MMTELVGLRSDGVSSGGLSGYDEGPLEVDSDGRLKAECVAVGQDQDCERRGHGHKQDDAGKHGGKRS
jgi:hypothetical protein